MADSLRRSLILPERDGHGDRVVVEARAITSTGHVVEHGARVQPIIERYLKRGQLTGRQARAAECLYRAWATGVAGAKLEAPGCVSYSPGGWTDAQVQAYRHYGAARDALGGRLWIVVFHVAIMDYSCERVANEVVKGTKPGGVLAILRVALDMAADSLGLAE